MTTIQHIETYRQENGVLSLEGFKFINRTRSRISARMPKKSKMLSEIYWKEATKRDEIEGE